MTPRHKQLDGHLTSLSVERYPTRHPGRACSAARTPQRLGLAVILTIADRCGAPEAIAETVASAVLAVVALACAFSARTEVLRLLARFGGWRGLAAAVAGLAVLIAFGAVYFSAVRWLGVELMAVSEPFREPGWPLWSICVPNSVVPAVFEELTFRGYVMARLGTLLTAHNTLVVQAAHFALLHLGVAIYPSHFFIGLVLGTAGRSRQHLGDRAVHAPGAHRPHRGHCPAGDRVRRAQPNRADNRLTTRQPTPAVMWA